MKKHLMFLFFIISLLVHPSGVFGQEAVNQREAIVQARVVEIISEGTHDVNPFSNQPGQSPKMAPTQDIKAVILEGNNKGKIFELTNDYTQLNVGDKFYVNETVHTDGSTVYTFNSPYRLNTLFIFLVIFLVVIFWLGGKQGVRGLASLLVSLILIVFVLIPAILNGFSPIMVSLGIASIIIIAGSYITHGFNKVTTAAVLGMMMTLLITGVMAYYAMNVGRLEGLDEHAIYLNFGSETDIDLAGLLFGGILIGLLGVLYDASISQAIAIEELHKMAPHIDRWTIYKRGVRIGREHIGALVDTLAIAYVGVSLPLVLLYAKSSEPFLLTINQELFATEIIRILVSSIGLILAVPITTLLAVYIIIKDSEGTK